MSHEMISQNSLLSRDRILEHMAAGNIIIDEFKIKNLQTASYDVSLGKHYFRQQDLGALRQFYSPWSEQDVKDVWGKAQVADYADALFSSNGVSIPEGTYPEDRVILIRPHETILANTDEYVGGRYCVTTSMHAKSSIGRNFLEVCKCAGWGDVGYFNRWTMEITNNSDYTIPLIVGETVAQIAFWQVDPFNGNDYSDSGKYQNGGDLETIKRTWNPYMMLPRLHKNRKPRNEP